MSRLLLMGDGLSRVGHENVYSAEENGLARNSAECTRDEAVLVQIVRFFGHCERSLFGVCGSVTGRTWDNWGVA